MAELLTFALATLAVYRVARMLTDEEGPLSLFARLRGAIDPDQETWIGRGLNCPLCVGYWAALAAALWLGAHGAVAWPMLPLWWLGVAGAAAWLHTRER